MIYKFGLYSIKIKSYTNKDLDLSDDYKHLKFDLYQKIFHILFIPIFPDEKEWKVIDTTTNKIAVTNPKIRTKLNIKALKKRNPILSYFGLIIFGSMLMFLFGLFISGIVKQEYKKYTRKKTHKKQTLQELDKINNPKINDLYLIKMIKITEKKDAYGNKSGIRKSNKYYSTYELDKFTDDSLYLHLKENHRVLSSIDIKLKKNISVSKKSISEITNKYRKIDFYTKLNNEKVEAIFCIDGIERENNIK